MENFDELEKLYKERNRIDEFIERVKSLAFVQIGGSQSALLIKNSDNGRYNFRQIENIIGAEKLNAIAQTFEDLLAAELYKVKELKEIELSKYKIVVTDKS